jgi:DNA-binding NarL/FixJ family response regulator
LSRRATPRQAGHHHCRAHRPRIVGARPKTVGKHLERIFEKLGVETRTAAARIATAAAERESAGNPA